VEDAQFDRLVTALGEATPRRHVIPLVTGAVTGLVGMSLVNTADAKKRRKKKKKKPQQQSPPPPPAPSVGCIPNCTDRECGNDGCGGSCGTCSGEQTCHGGRCCRPESRGATCAGRCGTWTNTCGQAVVCATCPAGQQCLSNGSCDVDCVDNADCSGGSGCSNPSVEGARHCITGPLIPFVTCPSTAECPPGSHCQDIGNGGVCIDLHV
jgi:hypothetical protein